MTRSRTLFCLLVPFAALAGCETPPLQAGDSYPGFGNANSQNLAVHIFDPEPESAQNTLINMDGARAALAWKRYRTGKVIKPERTQTSTLRISGQQGGGGN